MARTEKRTYLPPPRSAMANIFDDAHADGKNEKIGIE
jgi:hypothetical protein